MKQAINNKYVFWIALALPMVWLVIDNRVFGARNGELFYWTGALCGIFLLLTLAVTPLTKAFPAAPWRNWLIKRRRYLGVASFAYMFIHTVFWLYVASFQRIMKSFTEPDLLMAWASGILFTLLALTSNDFSVRKLGRGWKKLQNWVFVAGFLAYLHWFWAVGWDSVTIAVNGGAFALLILLRRLKRRGVRQG